MLIRSDIVELVTYYAVAHTCLIIISPQQLIFIFFNVNYLYFVPCVCVCVYWWWPGGVGGVYKCQSMVTVKDHGYISLDSIYWGGVPSADSRDTQ